MIKLFAKSLKNNETFSFYEDDVYHCLKVLKVRLKQNVLITYENQKYFCEFVSLEPLIAKIIDIVESKNNTEDINIDLFQAIIKPKQFDLIISSSSQLNVNKVYPVLFRRSQTQYNNEIRWNKISQNQSKQCNRYNHMIVHNTLSFNKLINKINENNYDLILIAYELENSNLLQTQDFINKKNICLIIGPEGGFDKTEILELSKLKNSKIIKLTNTILKSEIASIYTLSIINNNILLIKEKENKNVKIN